MARSRNQRFYVQVDGKPQFLYAKDAEEALARFKAFQDYEGLTLDDVKLAPPKINTQTFKA